MTGCKMPSTESQHLYRIIPWLFTHSSTPLSAAFLANLSVSSSQQRWWHHFKELLSSTLQKKMKAEVHCITLFQHLSSSMCVFMCMDHFSAGARKGCSKLGVFKHMYYNERCLNWRFAWDNWIYVSIKYFI